MKKRFISILMGMMLAVSCFAGCRFVPTKTEKIDIVATVFPVYDWLANIVSGVDDVELTLLINDGTDYHSYSPTVADILKVSESDLFVYIGGETEQWAESALAQGKNEKRVSVDLMSVLGKNVLVEEEVEGMQSEEEEEEYDEHFWLSVRNAVLLVNEINNRLCALDPDNADKYSSNTQNYIKKLEELDESYKEKMRAADLQTLLFADRFPFRYLVEDYDLSYYAAFPGCSAETEASFETVAFLVNKLNELNLPAVMKTENGSDKLARTIIEGSNDKKTQVLTLDSMQTTSYKDARSGVTYLSVMKKNLEVLEKALTAKQAEITPSPTDKPVTTPTPGGNTDITPTPGSDITPDPVLTGEPVLSPTVTPTNTPEPTSTLTPTNTPEPTGTSKPTVTPGPTNTPKPTNTPRPTNTPKPTNTPTPTQVPKQAIVWKDKALENAVRSALGKTSGDITENDVKGLTKLDLSGKGIVSIENLSVFTGLKTLYLNSNSITDISALSSLKNLTELSICFNKINSLTPLSGLTGLTILRATDNNITDISALSNLTRLEWVSLGNLSGGNNTITSVNGLRNLQSTANVNLVGNKGKITDWSPISHIKSVTGRPTH